MTAFHEAFDAGLTGGDFSLLWPHLKPGDRTAEALAVYRNTSMKARIDALAANYPTILKMVGLDWFQGCARAFVVDHPGDDPVLVAFGGAFPRWLARFEPAGAMPYLAPCARLDRAWTEAHVAGAARRLDPERAAALGPGLAGLTASLHPAARLFWFDWTAPSLWLAHRHPERESADMSWRPEPEGLLIYRPGDEVLGRRLSRPEWTFLDACRNGRPLGAAAMAAGGAPREASALFGRLLGLGVLTHSQLEIVP